MNIMKLLKFFNKSRNCGNRWYFWKHKFFLKDEDWLGKNEISEYKWNFYKQIYVSDINEISGMRWNFFQQMTIRLD